MLRVLDILCYSMSNTFSFFYGDISFFFVEIKSYFNHELTNNRNNNALE